MPAQQDSLDEAAGSGSEPTGLESLPAASGTLLQRTRRLWIAGLLMLIAASTVGVVALQSTRAPERRFERALQALQTNDSRKVIRELRVLREVPGYEPHANLLSGALLLKSGNYVEALDPLEAAAQAESLRARALTLEGEAYYRLGRFLDAERVLGTVLARDPDAIEARRWLASAFYDLGAAGHALEQLEIVSRQDSTDARPDRLMGKIFKDHEQFGQALSHYREALRRNPSPPDGPEFFRELGETLVKQNEFNEALQMFDRCPESADILVWRNKCLTALADPAGAQACLQRAIAIEPQHLGALVALAKESLSSAAPPAEALALLRRAVEAHPFDAEVHFLLAQAYGRNKQPDLADHELNAMREIQQLRQEFFRLREQSHNEPANADIRCRMAEICRRLGDELQARHWYQAALGADPENATARSALSVGADRSR